MSAHPKGVEVRFVALLKRTGGDGPPCWLWRGRVNGDGLPVLAIDGEDHPALELGYEMHIGRSLEEGERVELTCGQSTCVNPTHARTATATSRSVPVSLQLVGGAA